MKIQRSCKYLHKMFAVRVLKKALDFCLSQTHVRHLSFPAIKEPQGNNQICKKTKKQIKKTRKA